MDNFRGMLRSFGAADYLKIAFFGFGVSAIWACLHSIVLQVRLLDLVDAAQKNTYLGLLTFAGLVLALLIQPVAGTLSDRSRWRWGRRRPFILLGAVAALVFLIPGLGLATSYVLFFAIYCLLQLSTNSAQAAYQAFIPDLVPRERRGTASAVKTLLEMIGGVALIYPAAYFMDRYGQTGGGPWMWVALGVLGAVFLGMALATVLTVREEPLREAPPPLKEALRKAFRIDLRAERSFVWFLVSRFLIIATFTTIQTFALYYVKDVFGLTNPAQVSAQFLILAALIIPLSLFFAGRLSDKFGRRPIAIFSAVLGAGGLAGILFAQDINQLLICAAVIGASFGSFLSTNWALATQMAAPGEGGRYMGLANMATAGGSALARLVGPLIDYFNGVSANLGYTTMLIFCLVCFIAGAAILIWLEGRQRDVRRSP